LNELIAGRDKMKNKTMNLLVSGVGGQGVILISELIARAAIDSGYDAKKSEVHGAAQRGGPVVSHIRFGKKVNSPLCWRGQADILLAFERLEALRWAYYLKKGGLIILDDHEIRPAQFVEKVEYPENVVPFLESKGFTTYHFDCTTIAHQLGNTRASNIVLLGFASKLIELDEDNWMRALKENIPEKLYTVNEKAFYKGREMYENEIKGGK